MAAFVPGAVNVSGADLTTDMIVPLATTDPRAAQTTLADMLAFITDASAMTSTSITTVGDGTLTAAGMVGGVIVRSGPTANYTDTTATAATIITALGTDVILTGHSWLLYIKNLTAFQQTLAAGVGVTLSGNKDIINPNSAGVYLMTYTGAGAVSMQGLYVVGLSALPDAKITVGTAATAAAGDLTGAKFTCYENNASNATYTTRTGTQMFGDLPNARIGQSWMLAIRNLNATGLTLTAADASVTLSGTMTIAQNVTRTFVCTFTAADAITITSMGISAAAA